MNGHRALQNLTENGWKTTGLIKPIEEGIKPGIYNLFISKAAETENSVYEGLLLFIDKEKGLIYQQVNQDYITHKLESFEKFVVDDPVVSYVGIRGDEEREGYISRKSNIQSIFPFRKNIWSEEGSTTSWLRQEDIDFPGFYPGLFIFNPFGILKCEKYSSI